RLPSERVDGSFFRIAQLRIAREPLITLPGKSRFPVASHLAVQKDSSVPHVDYFCVNPLALPTVTENLWQSSASIEALKLRASLMQRVRAFFETRGLLEVETPLMSRAAMTDPHLYSAEVRLPDIASPLYLHT